ncbi:type II toxin-antitoxin system HicB family antitoxin [Crocosphaera chwakensis]|uniref:HicB protein n=1 Tax=Crocosphaera chwakensis CCY0110 TaxID=391612 RepID=A3ILC6_9CHRO|nr:type II toxin-antitoxin system HicB family antitoxin [Crocosphaera chwakensis]EAZ92577.1 HicB protein [Crocosphaera chwakensis CCY0110]
MLFNDLSSSIVPFQRRGKMQTMLTYKGYTGNIEIDLESGILFGRVLDIKDVVTFQGQTVEEACQEFYNSIDDYLEFCEEIGQSPEKPFSGKFHFRTTPETHRKITIAATKEGKSINRWMEDILTKAANQTMN